MSTSAKAGQLVGATYMGDGLVWQVRPNGVPTRLTQEEAESVFLLAGAGVVSAPVILTPEMPEGHDRSSRTAVSASIEVQRAPPALDQIAAYLRHVEDALAEGRSILHISSVAGRAYGAVLLGAFLIAARGLSAASCWANLLASSPPLSDRVSEAWDRFPAPSARSCEITATSLRVVDCLHALEHGFARDLFEGHRQFDSAAWRLLRTKFDASWLIPSELIVFGGEKQDKERSGTLRDFDLGPGSESPRDQPTLGWGASERSISGRQLGRQVSSPSPMSSPIFSPLDRKMSMGQESDSDFDDDNTCMAMKPKLVRAKPMINDGPVFRSFCFDIPDERGAFMQSSSSANFHQFKRSSAGDIRTYLSITPLLEKSAVGLVFQVNEAAVLETPGVDKPALERQLSAAGVLLSPCTMPPGSDGASVSARSSAIRSFLNECEVHRMKPGIKAGIAIRNQSHLDQSSLLAASYLHERHRFLGTAAHGWLRMCRPGAVATPAQEQTIRVLGQEAPSALPAPIAALRGMLLPPPLPQMPPSVNTDWLAKWRMEYRGFRVGDAHGAKGEVVDIPSTPPLKVASI